MTFVDSNVRLSFIAFEAVVFVVERASLAVALTLAVVLTILLLFLDVGMQRLVVGLHTVLSGQASNLRHIHEILLYRHVVHEIVLNLIHLIITSKSDTVYRLEHSLLGLDKIEHAVRLLDYLALERNHRLHHCRSHLLLLWKEVRLSLIVATNRRVPLGRICWILRHLLLIIVMHSHIVTTSTAKVRGLESIALVNLAHRLFPQI